MINLKEKYEKKMIKMMVSGKKKPVVEAAKQKVAEASPVIQQPITQKEVPQTVNMQEQRMRDLANAITRPRFPDISSLMSALPMGEMPSISESPPSFMVPQQQPMINEQPNPFPNVIPRASGSRTVDAYAKMISKPSGLFAALDKK